MHLVIGTIFTGELNTFTVPQSTHFSYFVAVILQGAILGFNENEYTLRIKGMQSSENTFRKDVFPLTSSFL